MLTTLLFRLKALNFYSSASTENNEYELRNENISTRIFLILWIISIVIIIYTAQVSVTNTIDVKEPSFQQFQLLSSRYSETLHCPWDNVAIPHRISLNNWIDHLRSAADQYFSSDFSYTGAYIFQTLASFCQLTNETISNALQTFISQHRILQQKSLRKTS